MTDQNISKPARRMARMPAENADSGPDQVLPQTEATAAPGARPESKIALVTRLLERNEGASLDELVTATGWLPHTTRAALMAAAETLVAAMKAGAAVSKIPDANPGHRSPPAKSTLSAISASEPAGNAERPQGQLE